MIPHSLRNQLSFLNSRLDEDIKKKTISSSCESKSTFYIPHLNETSIYDQFWQDLKEVNLVDSNRLVLDEIAKKYLLASFDQNELKCWFEFVCKPYHTCHGITYSILEFYAFLISAGPKVGVNIISTNLSGLGVSQIFGAYYVRTLNDCYKKRCAERNLISKNELIPKEIARDFQSAFFTCDLETCFEGDITIANDLVGKFFEYKWMGLINPLGRKYDLASAIMDVLSFAKSPDFPEVKVNNKGIYREDCFNDSKFTKDSFGPILRHRFYEKKNDVAQFLHQSLKVPCIEPIKKLIQIIESSQIPLDAIIDRTLIPKITPEHVFCGGLQSVFDCAGKIMRFIPNVKWDRPYLNVNLQTWCDYIISKTLGYDVLAPDLFCKFDVEDSLPFLKLEGQRHFAKDPIALIATGLNALFSLPRNFDHASKCESMWEEIMQWHTSDVGDSKLHSNKTANETSLFSILKEILDTKSLSFNICSDVLQVYGYLLLQISQKSDESTFKVQLRGSDNWQELKFSEKVDNQAYTVSIPLDLNCALKSLLMLSDDQLDKLTGLTNCLSAKKIFDFNRVRNSDSFINQALVCLSHSHTAMKRLGYDLLILFAHANPEFWILKCLIKYLHLVNGDPIAMTNLGLILDGFPNTLEVQKLVSSLKLFCQSNGESSDKGSLEYCTAMVSIDQIPAAVCLYSKLKLSINDQIKFIKSILAKDPLEAAKLLCQMQTENKFDDKAEIDLFLAVNESIQKNLQAPLYTSQLLSLSACAKALVRKHRVKSVFKQTLEPLVKIVNSLNGLGFITKTLDLLMACSRQQIVLVSANQDADCWLKTFEAGINLPEVDLKFLQKKFEERFTSKLSDNKLELRRNALQSEFSKHTYKNNTNALSGLLLQQKSEHENISELNVQMEKCINDILKHIGNLKSVEFALDFLERMISQDAMPRKAYVELALNVTVEWAKSCLTDVNILSKAYGILNSYLLEIKDSANESKIRKASLEIADALLDQKLPIEARNWMKLIFKIASSTTTGSIEHETEMFETQPSYFSLISINLPPKPSKALEVIFKLGVKELDLFKKIIDLLPPTSSNDVKLSTHDRKIFILQAIGFLKHFHPVVKQIGFELKLLCARDQENGKVGSDLSLINELIEHLPFILAGACPIVKSRLFETIKSLLKLSTYTEYADQYIDHLKLAENDCKSLYQANCAALALTAHEPLLKIGKKLIGKDNIDKLAPGLSQKGKIEIALAYIQGLFSANVSLALEYIKNMGNDLKWIESKEKESFFTSLINALIEKNLLKIAKVQLLTCTNQNVIQKDLETTTGLWLNLLNKMIHQPDVNFNKIAGLWLSQIELRALSKKHNPNTQIDLLTALIIALFNLKNDHSNDLAYKLCSHLSGFNLIDSQKISLLQIIENNIRTKFSKQSLSAGYKELKKIAWLHLTEASNLNLRKTYLQASIDMEDYNLAIDILSELQKQLDVEFVENQFKSLFSKLISLNGHVSDDQVKLTSCIRLIKEVDIICKNAEKLSYALQCLSAAIPHSLVLVDDKLFLLKTALHLIENDVSVEDSIIEIVDLLQKFLSSPEAHGHLSLNKLMPSIISCHETISRKLQTKTSLEKFCAYLHAIYAQNIAIKIAPIVTQQILWAVSEYLKDDKRDAHKLLDVHKLLVASLQLSISTPIAFNITFSLANDLLAHQHVTQAIKWINYSISNIIFTELTEAEWGSLLYKWSKSLFDLNELDHCLSILNSLKKLKEPPLNSGELFLKISKVRQEKDIKASVQLMLENWDFIQTNCTSENSSDKHLEDLMEKIFSCDQDIDVLSLFSSLMSLYNFNGIFSKLEHLKSCCIYIEMNPKCLDLLNCAKSYEIIKSIFFKTSKPDHKSLFFFEEQTMIIPLILSTKKELVFLGISQLNIYLDKALNLENMLSPERWLKLCRQAINNWNVVLNDSHMIDKEWKEFNRLLTFYTELLDLDFPKDLLTFHKELILIILKNSAYQNSEAAAASLQYTNAVLKQIGHDIDWLEKFSPLLINSLCNFHLKKASNCVSFINYFRVFTKAIEEINPEFLKTYFTQSFHKFLDCKLDDSVERAVMIYQASEILIQLVSMYKSDSKDNLAFSKVDNIAEIDPLIEKFLFCSPIIFNEYSLKSIGQSDELKEIVNFNCRIIDRMAESKELIQMDNTNKLKDENKIDSNYQLNLTLAYYDNYFKSLGLYLSGFSYHISNPEKIMMALMLAGESLTFDQFQIGTIDLSMKVLSKLTNQLIAKQNNYSSALLFDIFQKLPNEIWKIFPTEISDLLALVMKDSFHYPGRFPLLAKFLADLHKENRAITEWSNLSKKLTFIILNKMDKWICLDSHPKGDKINLLFLEHAANFFISAFENGIIDGHPEQIHYYTKCFYRLAMTNFKGANTPLIAKFINGIKILKAENKEEIFNVIHQNFDNVFKFSSELFFENFEMYQNLCNEKFFNNRISQLEGFLKKFIMQFEDEIEYNVPDIPHSHTRFLEMIFHGISIILNKTNYSGRSNKSYFNVIEVLHLFILKYTHVFLPMPETVEILERNLCVLSLLKSVKYFEIYEDKDYTFRCYKNDYKEKFVDFYTDENNSESLRNAMTKIFTNEELEEMISSLSKKKNKKDCELKFYF